MGKILRMLFNQLGIILLISVVFFSTPQQVLPSFEQLILKAGSEAPAANYPYLDFSTYFGGSDEGEHGFGIAVTEDDNCYIIRIILNQKSLFVIIRTYFWLESFQT
ncbi:MAG: hypothetical protein ACTSO7_12940 [Candidatus Heimdallarchaeota archaeon]